MKRDFRLTYPLWNMAFIILLGMMAYGFNEYVVSYSRTEDSFRAEAQIFDGLWTAGPAFVYLILITIYLVQLRKHNRENPNQRIASFSIRPPEYLEEDEGMQFITRKAVQKVYTFFTWALPALAVASIFFQLPRLFIIWGILAVAFGQYLIYYLEIRKYFKEDA